MRWVEDAGESGKTMARPGITAALHRRYQRLFGLNIETYSPTLKTCLRGLGVDPESGRLFKVSPYLTVRIIDLHPGG